MLEHCYCGHFRHIDFQMSLSAGIQRYLSHPCKTYEQKIDLGVINIVLVLFFLFKNIYSPIFGCAVSWLLSGLSLVPRVEATL